ncbi:hypothetical protein GCM10027614_75580 [Micromonospora vulcania]
MLGTAEFDVDWAVPVQTMREELRRLVESTDLWDGRVCVLQLTDATGGTVRVRALVSAADAGSLWDLRCLVREHLVGWIRDNRPTAMPRVRTELGDANSNLSWQWVQPRRPSRTTDTDVPDDARVFGGSDDGDARSEAFVGPEDPRPRTPSTPFSPLIMKLATAVSACRDDNFMITGDEVWGGGG